MPQQQRLNPAHARGIHHSIFKIAIFQIYYPLFRIQYQGLLFYKPFYIYIGIAVTPPMVGSSRAPLSRVFPRKKIPPRVQARPARPKQ